MGDPLFPAGQQRARRFGDMRLLEILAGEGPDRFQRLEAGHDQELDLVADVAAQHPRAQVAGNGMGGREEAVAQEGLIGVGPVPRGPTPPDPLDHERPGPPSRKVISSGAMVGWRPGQGPARMKCSTSGAASIAVGPVIRYLTCQRPPTKQ